MTVYFDNINSSLNSLTDYIEQIKSEINFIIEKMQSLPELWDSESANEVYNTFFDEYKPILNKYYSVLENYCEFLKNLTPVFNAIEDYYDYGINVD